MAASYGSTLNAVSVVEVNEEFYALAPELAEQMGRKSAEVLSAVRKKVEQAGISVETFVKEGDAHAEIVRVAGEQKADVIFIGSHGKTGIKKFIIGSVAEKVIGFAPCPVLVVKS
jgi:nucleotide-binding universal stress UspA family protein